MEREFEYFERIGTEADLVPVKAKEMLEALAEEKSIWLEYADIEGDFDIKEIKNRFAEAKGKIPVITGCIVIRNSKINGVLSLRGAVLNEDVDFGGTIFEQHADFSDSIFVGDVDCKSAIFRDGIDSHDSAFMGSADFNSTVLEGIADFQSTIFHKKAYFHVAEFNDLAYFQSTIFLTDAYFRTTLFNKDVDFDRARFNGNTIFTHATFRTYTDLKSTIFEYVTSFRWAKFLMNTEPSEIIFALPETYQIDFSHAEFCGKGQKIQEKQTHNNSGRAGPWKAGLFFFLIAFVVIPGCTLLYHYTSPGAAMFGFVAGVLSLSAIGAFQLRQDERLREKGFLRLMGMVFSKMPSLKGLRSAESPAEKD